jgi:hypothetical protein
VGDFVYLKVSPTKGVQRFGIKGKLAPRYIGPYEIIEACGLVAYKLKLPPKMSAIHNVFHVSQLKKCVRLSTEIIAEPELEIEPDLSYCNALNLGVEFFLLFSHQIRALLSFLFLFRSFFLISNQYSDRCPCRV